MEASRGFSLRYVEFEVGDERIGQRGNKMEKA
jgi:hypothetical protein